MHVGAVTPCDRVLLLGPHKGGFVIRIASAMARATPRLARLGVDRDTPSALARRIITVNLYALTLAPIAFANFVVFHFARVPWLDLPVLPITALLALPLWLNHTRRTLASRLTLVLVADVAVFVYAIALGAQAGLQVIFLPLACAPIALFDVRERVPYVLTLAAPIMLGAITHWHHATHAPLLMLPDATMNAVHISVTVSAILILFGVVGHMLVVNASWESALEQRHQQLFTHATDALIFVDSRQRVVDANARARAAFGYSADELVGMDLSALSLDVSRHVMPTADNREQSSMEGSFTRKDGTSFPADIWLSGFDWRGESHVMISVRDVTERKAYEAQLMLADRLASAGTLASGAAHEINNPLTSVELTLAWLSRHLPSPGHCVDVAEAAALQRALKRAEDGCERVAAIVRDLKTFSRGEENHLDAVDVREVMDATISIAQHEIRDRARLLVHYGDVEAVQANESRLGQVFLNLVINAAQAIPPSDPDHNSIRIDIDMHGDDVVVEVSDTGSGIAPESLPRIFDPFFTTKPPGVGTGLGLFVCRNIVNAFDGSLAVQSRQGEGTTFRVAIPTRRPPPRLAQVNNAA